MEESIEKNNGIKKNVIAGFFWKAMENGGDQLVTFFISIVLARLLGPEKYGKLATMLIFISIANVIIQNGFQTALIQKKEVNAADLSSVFWVGLIISTVLYAVIFSRLSGNCNSSQKHEFQTTVYGYNNGGCYFGHSRNNSSI